VDYWQRIVTLLRCYDRAQGQVDSICVRSCLRFGFPFSAWGFIHLRSSYSRTIHTLTVVLLLPRPECNDWVGVDRRSSFQQAQQHTILRAVLWCWSWSSLRTPSIEIHHMDLGYQSIRYWQPHPDSAVHVRFVI